MATTPPVPTPLSAARPDPARRLLDAVAAIQAAGGVVLAIEPLAHPDDPSVLVAHRILPGLPTPAVADAVKTALAAHTVDTTGLVPHQPDDVEPELEEPTP